MLDCRCDEAQRDEDRDNDNIQPVSKEELLPGEGVAGKFPALCPLLCEGKLRLSEQVNQMVFVCEGFMLAILDRLQVLPVDHLRVEHPVLEDVGLVLDLFLERCLLFAGSRSQFPLQRREALLMLRLQGFHFPGIGCCGSLPLSCTGCLDFVKILRIIVCLQVRFSLRDQLFDLRLVRRFCLLCL